MKILRCPNRDCRPSGKTGSGNLIRFGLYQTRWGKRRRYRCQRCKRTFCSNTGTPYYRLQHRRATFDQVATLSVEGLNKSAIARVECIGWNTVDRWLENGILPPPIRINGLRYWRQHELEQVERELGQRRKRAGRRSVKTGALP